jgi:hypothetical protein
MAADQQLVDYIKKAREAQQSDDQTRALLYKNGWAESEVKEAFAVLEQPKTQTQPQAQPQAQTKPQTQPQTQSQNQQKPQQQPQSQPQTQYQQKPQAQTQQTQQPQAQVTTQPKPEPQVQQENKPQVQSQPVQQPQVQTAQPAQSQYKPVQSTQPRQQAKPTTTMPRGGGSHTVLKILVVFILLAGLGGAGFYVLWSRIYDPAWNPFRPNPETIIIKAIENLKNITSENFDATFAISGKNIQIEQGSGNFDLTVNLNGAYDNSNPDKKLSSTQISLAISANDTDGQSYNASIAGESILVGQNLYLRLLNLSSAAAQGMQNFFSINLNQLTNKWIKFDMSQASGLGLSDYAIENTNNQKELQRLSQIIADLQKILIDKKVFNIKQLENIQGADQKEYHYSLSINRNNLDAALPEIYNVLASATANDGQLPADVPDEAKFRSEMNAFLDQIGPVSVELFIGQTNNMLYKVQISSVVDINKFNSTANGTVNVKLNLARSGVNQPTQITEPTEYQNFIDLFGSIVSSRTPIEIDLISINTIAQSTFDANNSYSSLCFKGLLNGYNKEGGDSLVSLNNDIIKQDGKKPNCYASATNFCVSTQLSDMVWACVGPGGKIGKTQCVSAATICK